MLTDDEKRIEAEAWLDRQIELCSAMENAKYLEFGQDDDVEIVASNMDSFFSVDRLEDGSFRSFKAIHIDGADRVAKILGVETSIVDRGNVEYPKEVRFNYKDWVFFSLKK